MLFSILSHLGSGFLGALLKVFAARIQNAHDLENTKLFLIKENYAQARKSFDAADNYTKHSRRVFGLMLVGTYCIVLILWSVFPGYPIITFVQGLEPDEWGFTLFGVSLFGATAPADLGNRTFILTTGHFVLGSVHFIELILGAYFMPIGKR
jgi:hypothetical protein